jgi:hypothetical protein
MIKLVFDGLLLMASSPKFQKYKNINATYELFELVHQAINAFIRLDLIFDYIFGRFYHTIAYS